MTYSPHRISVGYRNLIYIVIIFFSSMNWTNPALCLDEFTIWGDMVLTKNLKSIDPALKNWFIYQEGWARKSPETNNLDTLLTRSGIGYRYSDHITFAAGYGYAWQHPVGNKTIEDQRPWQQIIIQENFDKLDFSSRSRFEEIILNKIQTPIIRFRERFKIAYPLSESYPLSIIMSEEMFIRLNDAGPLMHSGFEQNRGFVGFGYLINKNTIIEIGYLNQILLMKSILTDAAIKGSMTNHALSMNIHFNLD